MKTTTFVSFAAVAASLLAQPAFAEPASVAIDGAPTVVASYAPDSPAAAFDRLFASRTATPVQPLAVRSPDTFERQFQIALWSPNMATPTLAARTGRRAVEERK